MFVVNDTNSSAIEVTGQVIVEKLQDPNINEVQYYVAVRRQYADRELSFVVGKYDTPGKAACVFNIIMTALRHRCPVLYLPADNENFDTRMSILEANIDRGVY